MLAEDCGKNLLFWLRSVYHNKASFAATFTAAAANTFIQRATNVLFKQKGSAYITE